MTVLCATLLLPLLTGCQGHRIIARINGDAITDEQYLARVERVVPQEFQQLAQGNIAQINLDAGAVALVTTLREKAIDILAKNKNVVPSSDTIDQIYKYDMLADPNLPAAIKNNTITEDELKKSIRLSSELLGIGTDGAKVDPKEVEDEFKNVKSSTNPADQLDIPAR
jgi:hypothetical protein